MWFEYSIKKLLCSWLHFKMLPNVKKKKKRPETTLSLLKDNIGKSESLIRVTIVKVSLLLYAAVHPHPGLASWALRAAVFL